VGTVPIFVVAGFIEGFLTRHTEVNDWVRLVFILLSLAFVIFYFVVYPRKLYKKQKE
jgi:ATP/ADP translocase